MIRTVYSTLSTEEVAAFAMVRDNRTDMEVELAQRLLSAKDALEDEQRQQPIMECLNCGHDS